MVSERLVDVTQDYIGECVKSMDSSAHITAMRRNTTVLVLQYSAEN